MTIVRIDPSDYFADVELCESRLISIDISDTKPEIDFVFRYMAEAISDYFAYLQEGGEPASYRCNVADFRLLRFHGTERVEVIRQSALGSHVTESKLDTDILYSQTRLVTAFDCEQTNDGHNIRICFDSFGEVRWQCQRIGVATRRVQISRIEDDYKYCDIDTQQAVDPARPFGDIAKGGWLTNA